MIIKEILNKLRAKIGLKAECILETDEERQCVWELIEKADKYGWHDLRKNPEDLPTKEENEYLIAWKIAEYTDIYYEVGSWEFMEGEGYGFHHSHSEYIIAWREIEPFEEIK